MSERRAWVGLAVLVVPCFLVSMDAHVLNLAVPMIVADIRPSSAQLLWIVDGYVFLVAGSLLAMGAIGDRIGRRRLLLVGATLFAAASLLAVFADSAPELIVARILMGLAGASLMPSTLALIRGMFTDRRQRTAALGVWSASFSLGGLLGPLIGGALLDHFWWGSVFLLALPCVLVLLAVGPRVLPEFRDPDAISFDVFGAAQSLLALLAIVYGIKRAAEGGGSLGAGAAILVGLVVVASFVRRQKRIARPMIDPAPFRSTAVRIALVSSSLTFFALYGTQVAVAQYLQWVVGLSPLRAGLWTVPAVLAYLAGTTLAPAFASRFPRVRVITAGLVIAAAGCACSVLVLTGVVDDLVVIVIGTVTFSVGLAPVYTLSTDLIVSNTRPEQAGVAGAVAESGAELGGALGIALLGSLGVTVFRGAMQDATEGVPEGVERTLGDAVAVAGTLPGPRGDELLEQARWAFEQAYASISGAASVAVVAALVAIAVIRRHARNRIEAGVV